MQNYEILYILPGTLGEDEVAPVVGSIKELVEKSGGTSVKTQDLGKSRIAYPIKHIRYGYFQLCSFQIDPSKMMELKEKLRLKQNLLRLVVRRIGTGGSMEIDKISAISDVTIRETNMSKTATDETKPEVRETREVKEVKEPQDVIASAEEMSRQMDSASTTQQSKAKAKAKAKSETTTETKAENIKMEDIDKKLDELLETGIDV